MQNIENYFNNLDQIIGSYDGILCMEGDRRLGGVFAN